MPGDLFGARGPLAADRGSAEGGRGVAALFEPEEGRGPERVPGSERAASAREPEEDPGDRSCRAFSGRALSGRALSGRLSDGGRGPVGGRPDGSLERGGFGMGSDFLLEAEFSPAACTAPGRTSICCIR